MKNKQAFTLIELLVVVLIIGILAAVALPQYRAAVASSRFANLKLVTEKINQAQELYYTANGAYSSRFENLDIDLPSGGTPDAQSPNSYNFDWGYCFTGMNDTNERTCCVNSKIQMRYCVWGRYSAGDAKDTKSCTLMDTTDPSDWRARICQKESGRKTPFGTDENNHPQWRWTY